MTKLFCDWCKQEMTNDTKWSIDVQTAKVVNESRVGLQVGGNHEICINCYRRMSNFILDIKESNI